MLSYLDNFYGNEDSRLNFLDNFIDFKQENTKGLYSGNFLCSQWFEFSQIIIYIIQTIKFDAW